MMARQIRKLAMALWLSSLVPLTAYAVAVPVNFTANLIALPCAVDPLYGNSEVDFGGNINSKDLLNGRHFSSKNDIEFRLTDCDTSLGNSISVIFNGVSTTKDGLLNVDQDSQATGIAVGLENKDGEKLPINGRPVKLVKSITDNEMTIQIRSYLTAVEGKTVDTIKPGTFRATLTYTWVYQ